MPASYSKKREPLRPSKTWGSLMAALQRKPSLDILSGESHLHRQPGGPSHADPSKTPPRFSQAAKLGDRYSERAGRRPAAYARGTGQRPGCRALALKERAATTRTTDREFNRVWNEDQQASRLRPHQHGLTGDGDCAERLAYPQPRHHPRHVRYQTLRQVADLGAIAD